MDISTVKPVERILEILHPVTNEPLGIRVTGVSMSDPAMRKIKKKILDRRLALERKNQGFKADDIENNLNELLFSAMTGWDWYAKDVSFHGSKPEFTKENVFKVFDELEWFQTQFNEFISETAAFYG